MKINDIKSEFYALQELIENEEFNEETGELIDNSEAIKQLLSEINEKVEDKLLNIEYIKQDYAASAEAIKQEVSRLQDRQKSYLRKVESLKSLQMYLMDGKKFETPFFNFGYRKSSQVEIIDDTLIDAKYLKEKITYTPDKKAIAEDIKNGIDVVGAELVEKQNLSVR